MQKFVRPSDSSPKSDKPNGVPARNSGVPQVSLIGSDITITGNIEASVDLHIQGRVDGDVRCATLILNEGGRIKGGIHAARARIAGSIEGTIEVGDLALGSTGQAKGEITYRRLLVANGASIEGKLKCDAKTEQPAEGPAQVRNVHGGGQSEVGNSETSPATKPALETVDPAVLAAPRTSDAPADVGVKPALSLAP